MTRATKPRCDIKDAKLAPQGKTKSGRVGSGWGLLPIPTRPDFFFVMPPPSPNT